ncbi:MAG TPA: transglutaminase family protein [Abditibacteriaceae bacterium]|jgi:transglutaminase-like putative cysteine protease
MEQIILRVGCDWVYSCDSPTPTMALAEVQDENIGGIDVGARILEESWHCEPNLPTHSFRDLYGNRTRRFMLPKGETRFGYDARVDVSALPDSVEAHAWQLPVELLDDELLHWTLASRYCPADAMSDEAWRMFGEAPLGWQRVQTVCDWIHENIVYTSGSSTVATTALNVFEARAGICRDFAHLGITFCRALGIPARYCFGYLPDINVPRNETPMDFHAWFEVWLEDETGGRWRTFDARHNTPRIGRVAVARGRDAVDCALVTAYGAANFQSLVVWAEQKT